MFWCNPLHYPTLEDCTNFSVIECLLIQMYQNPSDKYKYKRILFFIDNNV